MCSVLQQLMAATRTLSASQQQHHLEMLLLSAVLRWQ